MGHTMSGIQIEACGLAYDDRGTDCHPGGGSRDEKPTSLLVILEDQIVASFISSREYGNQCGNKTRSEV